VIGAASALGSGLRVLDGGPLRHARALEAMCALAIGLNRRYKAKSARFRVVGV
jgi:predicted dinucleotide-binding enzyme